MFGPYGRRGEHRATRFHGSLVPARIRLDGCTMNSNVGCRATCVEEDADIAGGDMGVARLILVCICSVRLGEECIRVSGREPMTLYSFQSPIS